MIYEVHLIQILNKILFLVFEKQMSFILNTYHNANLKF